MSYTFIIFGGNGDLTYRKLLPALYNLFHEKIITTDFSIIAVGRRDYTNERYHADALQALHKFSRFPVHPDLWDKLKEKISYFTLDFNNPDGYKDLDQHIKKINQFKETKRIYYLAVAPKYFEIISNNLYVNKMHHDNDHWPKVVIEKPFGRDLQSARYLNEKIVHAFKEENTYRIDHYLGKEMIQNIMVIRFANTVFEPIWNNQYIEQVQITSSETLGIGTRGEYYEKSGAIRDMAQSHLLQLLSLIAMEKPKTLKSEDIKNEKVKVLKALKKFDENNIASSVALGQYEGYTNEDKVKKESRMETFVAFKAYIENKRWQGVPFYIRTGKKMPIKTTEIIIEFKKQDQDLYANHEGPNYLVIKIQPREGIFFQFNIKKPGAIQQIIPVKMDFCQNCQIGINSPEAYERLLYDIMREDLTLFARWDEVENSWLFIDDIINYRRNYKQKFPNYKEGEWGPKEADEIIKNDNHEWLYIEE